MKRKEHYKSTLCRIQEICEIAKAHYEEGNQAKCYRAVWHKYIEPKYGICYRTFLNYIATPLPKKSGNKSLTFSEHEK